ncbi:MAG: FHA domain-containing protein [Bdellovibrionaceae bacterium]|nr:FHA domain-containing protein [Bdellovibrionales bacterium]MCB9255457.1 FHA domain-containing protein [Pseudobdellovibrionaceae bacterium]
MKFEIVKNGRVVDVRDLAEGSHKVGRAKDCDLVLPSPQISKQHALIVVKGNKAAIVDLGSSNGVFVNGVLVRKQRIRSGDDVVIADYHIRLGSARSKVSPQVPGDAANAPAMPEMEFGLDGAAAFQAQPLVDAFQAAVPETPAPEFTPQEKLMLMMDEKVLSPFYGVMKSVDWRMLMVAILGGGFLLAVAATVFSVLPWGQEIATREALKRAHTVISQVVRENYRVLSKTGDFTKLSVAAGESEVGMLAVAIVDPRANTIIAPTKLLNKSITDPRYLLAIEDIKRNGKELVDIEKGDGVYVVAQPISLYSKDTNAPELSAIVIADFEIPRGIHAVYEPLVRAVLFAILLVIVGFYMITKMISHPIVQLNDQLDAALKGDNVNIACDYKFPELENLAQVVNFTVTRMKQSAGEGVLSQDDSELQNQAYERAIQGVDQATSDALLLLDREKKIVFVGNVAEELLSIRSQYSLGKNISDATSDSAFAGTVIDLIERVLGSLGETAQAELEVNGTMRNVVAVGHKNSDGSIHYVLVTVKMNEQA